MMTLGVIALLLWAGLIGLEREQREKNDRRTK